MSNIGGTANWISLSDMMTGLMLVFLFLSIISISDVQKREQENKRLVTEFEISKQQIYEDLKITFKDKFEQWEMVLDEKDLTIKFTNPDVLFDYRSDVITDKFMSILSEFIPMYISVINKPEYSNSIKEVRIEGHTALWHDYMESIELSQARSNSVLEYILDGHTFSTLADADKRRLKFWITANGLGLGHSIDEDGELTYRSNKPIDKKSRRVEFRLVTTSEELVDEIIKQYKK